MNDFKRYGWEKNIKTSLKNIRPGDLFCFVLDEKKFGAGRIMTPNSLGHVAEIFDDAFDKPEFYSVNLKRLGDPIILDSYSLFDLKAEGDWRIVAHQSSYKASADESVRFVYGVADNVKLVDIFDNETGLVGGKINYPLYSPMGDEEIKDYFNSGGFKD